MTTLALPRSGSSALSRLYWILVQVPWHGALTHTPSLLLALPAAYASAQFAMHASIFPWPLAWCIGVGFEWIWLGSMAISNDLRKDRHWFDIVNGFAVGVSILYVALYSATQYGVFGDPTVLPLGWKILFSIVHAAPLAGLNWVYNKLTTLHAAQVQVENDATKFRCPDCGRGFPSQASLDGHKRVHRP